MTFRKLHLEIKNQQVCIFFFKFQSNYLCATAILACSNFHPVLICKLLILRHPFDLSVEPVYPTEKQVLLLSSLPSMCTLPNELCLKSPIKLMI